MEHPSQSVPTDVAIEDPAAVLAALERAKADAKRFRDQRDAALAQLEQAKQEAVQQATATLHERLVRAEAQSALLAEGVESPARLAKRIDVSAVQLTDDGLDGLSEQLDVLRADFPELFATAARAKARKLAAPSVDATAESAPPKLSGTEMQVARVLGLR